ncbi:flagellar motor protein MotB [Kaistia algarum]|uniref:OmpA family protein n=1 Tax=Kaistia algarum TaxID=2083279 RepID=UPI000CE8A8E6|nr:OmpA family protein [Kaistia algarum]MCX5514502.1 OmpA family protein [Kaistia algarum]PPE79228.1 flagellar motor protein MotB [Kaistia algarum]
MFKAGFLLLLLVMSSTVAYADATLPDADIDGAKDNPLTQRYDGSWIVSYEQSAYTDFTIPLAPLRPDADPDKRDVENNVVYAPEKSQAVEGKLTRIAYLLPEGRSPLEVLRNFQTVITNQGGALLFECKTEACGGAADRASQGGGGDMSLMMTFFHARDLKLEDFSNGACALTSTITDQRFFAAKLPQDGGEAYVTVQTFSLIDDLYCKAFNGRTIALVQVVEPKPRDQKMVVVTSAQMESGLSQLGSISLYGILFDTDKAVLKAASAPTLQEIAALLEQDPKMAVLVVGHTDNHGDYGHNVDLSERRAQAVKTALVKTYGIDAKRLTAAGAGMMAPVASNDSEEGRAKNRRVVLVKAN